MFPWLRASLYYQKDFSEIEKKGEEDFGTAVILCENEEELGN